jgi:hypothetical protein
MATKLNQSKEANEQINWVTNNVDLEKFKYDLIEGGLLVD